MTNKKINFDFKSSNCFVQQLHVLYYSVLYLYSAAYLEDL